MGVRVQRIVGVVLGPELRVHELLLRGLVEERARLLLWEGRMEHRTLLGVIWVVDLFGLETLRRWRHKPLGPMEAVVLEVEVAAVA